MIGTVSHLSKVKNIGFLIETISRMPSDWPIHLLVLGDGSEREYLEKLAIELNVLNQIKFFGHVQQPVVYYRMMDIFALCSLTEQMPVAVLEGMAMGLPIVSTDVGDVRSMVSRENTPYVIPLNKRLEYQNAIAFLIRNKSLRKSIGDSNRKKCLELYSSQKMIQRYHRLYYRTLGIS